MLAVVHLGPTALGHDICFQGPHTRIIRLHVLTTHRIVDAPVVEGSVGKVAVAVAVDAAVFAAPDSQWGRRRRNMVPHATRSHPMTTECPKLNHEMLDSYQVSIEFLATAVEVLNKFPKGYYSASDQLQRASLHMP